MDVPLLKMLVTLPLHRLDGTGVPVPPEHTSFLVFIALFSSDNCVPKFTAPKMRKKRIFYDYIICHDLGLFFT